ncbi:LexA family protein [Pseudomonas aeruginosa]
MSTMTPRRRQILNFIRSHSEAEGQPPSLEEIAAACGLKSRSAAQKNVRALEASGELEVTPGKARSARPKRPKAASPGAAPLFEVSAQDVADLSDSDLRELVARLCIAGLAESELPPAPVTWGGDQRAPDGGIDVRVRLPAGTAPIAHFLRADTGFQVKATKMGLGEIQREMCPNGLLRPSIQELVRARGSYIIATSDSAADEEYRKRVAAMRAAAAMEVEHEQAEFDYYDARRLADWTNQHPGVVAWVRSRLSRPLQGWQPFGQWADTRGSKPQPFLPDEKLRLVDPHELDRKFPLAEGLAHVRSALRTGGRSVRLTGLSGVGKTRFAQALFEADSASDPLPSELAVYTDTSFSPNPPPLAVLDELLASGRRAILVVDNCASQLHNQLTARCKASSRVSLLTIEYDIREDLPSETNVFHLETASSDLIEKIIGQQFPQISQVNVSTIARFADGNSRVAIALANTMDRNESLAGLSDRELLDRLFWLGKEVQHELMVAAQACALVYSFDGEDLDGELAQLAALTDESVTTLYRRVADLEHRGLAQRRGVWRAVLPHAVANTLAIRALDSIPYSLIARNLVQGQSRLLRSFSRRLGYLHDSPKAAAIVRNWLSEGELLGGLSALTSPLADVLINIAPVEPEAVLSAIERAVQGPDSIKVLGPDNSARTGIVRLLRLIAYEPKWFERCMQVLTAFALAEDSGNRVDATRGVIASLFFLYLSGTHATTEQRVRWVTSALNSPNDEIESIGRQCLSAALESHQYSSFYSFEFGARPRDYGWSPRGLEAQEWFDSFVALAVHFGLGSSRSASLVRDLLATQFRSLWAVAGAVDALEAASLKLLKSGWEKGWLAIRQTLRFDGEGLPPESKARLQSLEDRAKPTTLVGRVKAIVLNGHSASVDFADGESESTGYEHADRLSRELGGQVARDADVFAAVAPLVVRNEQGRQWTFGQGLAAEAHSIDDCWSALIVAFENTPEEHRSVQVLRGFLDGVFVRERPAFERLLDIAMERASLVKWVPILQLSAPLDDTGCARLLASMDNPSVPAWVFQYLGFGRATEKLGDNILAQLLQRLSIKPEGLEVAIEILSMHIFGDSGTVGPQVTQIARSLLASVPLRRNNHGMDHALRRLVLSFLSGSDGEAAARVLLTAARRGFEEFSLSRYDLSEMLAALFEVQLKISLEILVGDGSDERDTYILHRALAGGRRSSALAGVPIDALISWCKEGGVERWSHVAPLLPAFEPGTGETGLQWSKGVLALITQAPQPLEVARSLVGLIEPMSWSGSRAEAIKQRLPLLDELARMLGAAHAEQVAIWRSQITKTMERELRRELEDHRINSERFE